jgi:uncharacterized oligopeptide transporter (OPT) family protein
MIPMRRYIIVHEHGKIPSLKGRRALKFYYRLSREIQSAKITFISIAIGAVYKICTSALYLWNETVSWGMKFLQKTEFSLDGTPSLLGVGFIIGARTSSLLFCGGGLAWWVIIPLIRFFGEGNVSAISPALIPIKEMSATLVWSNYVRYIGAGAVAIGGFLSIFSILPIIAKTIQVGLKEMLRR